MEKKIVVTQSPETLPFSVLTYDERKVLEGLSYKNLSETFLISETVLTACQNVHESRSSRPKFKDASQRVQDYYSPRTNVDKSAEKHITFANIPMPEGAIEFVQQFYKEGEELIVGDIHQGRLSAVALDSLDGISDNKAVVQIHNHDGGTPQSRSDIIYALNSHPQTPEYCLYFVAARSKIFLMFPTKESPRMPHTELEQRLKKYDISGDDYKEKHMQAVIKIAEEFKLGLYVSDYSLELKRFK